MRFDIEWRCSNFVNCKIRQQFGGRRCFFQGRLCEYMVPTAIPQGSEMEVVVRPRTWGTSLGVVIPKRTCDRLGIHAGDELRVLVQRLRGVASMPPSEVVE